MRREPRALHDRQIEGGYLGNYPIPRSFSLLAGIPPDLPRRPNAIYIATGPARPPILEAVDLEELESEGLPSDELPIARPGVVEEAIRYVGSTEAGVSARLRQHFRDFDRAASWYGVWVIGLKHATPRPTIETIEGAVGTLLKPIDNLRLPRSAALAGTGAG